MTLFNQQAVRWIETLRSDLNCNRRKPRLSKENRLRFISEQYERLYLLNRAIAGSVTFIGAPPIGEQHV